jgi:hypothetical protein
LKTIDQMFTGEENENIDSNNREINERLCERENS